MEAIRDALKESKPRGRRERGFEALREEHMGGCGISEGNIGIRTDTEEGGGGILGSLEGRPKLFFERR